MKICFAVTLLTTAVVSSGSLSAADPFWPGWLGPDRTGWVTGFQSPEQWPQTLSSSWSVDVGTGYGTPLVIDGLVFQHARQKEEEVLWCIELKSGNTVWRQSVAVPFKVRGGGEFHGKGPKSSPVYADRRIFTLTITGDLIAWDADSGNQLWRSDYGTKYRQNHPHWGTSTSPIVDGPRVIMHFGNDDAGELVALDVKTGKEVWTNGKDGASYSSPLLVDIQGVKQIVEWNHQALVGVNSATGKQLWSYPFAHESHNQNMPTPTFHEGLVLLGAENRGLHCFEPQLINGEWKVDRRWSQKTIALDMSTAVMNGDLLFGMSHYGKGRLFCVKAESGEILWQSEGRVGQNAAFLSVPGHVVVLNDRGKLQVFKASGEGHQAVTNWTVSQEPTWAPPVLLSDGILIKDRASLKRLVFAE